MKKSKVLISALLVIALCVSIMAGTTFALFSSEDKVNIAITSGKVDVSATVSNIATTSMNVEQGTVTEYDVTKYLWENGGFASVSGKTLTLSNITPGDSVSFDIVIVNDSSVSIQYRTVIAAKNDNGLMAGLVVTINGVAYKGEEIKNAWTLVAPNTAIAPVKVTISLPESATDEYADKSCDILYAVEAVQGNADTHEPGVAVELLFSKDFIENGENAAERIRLAKADVEGKTYATLAEAASAVDLLDAALDGSFSGSVVLPDGRTHNYVNNHPLYIINAVRESDFASALPLAKIVYTVYGTVPVGADSVNLTGVNACDVELKGASKAAKLESGSLSVSATVAGGYDNTFRQEGGTLDVSNIEFLANQGNVSLNANGCTLNIAGGSAKRADFVKINISDCVFHTQLYAYSNDSCPKSLEYSVTDCEFYATETSSTYAIFAQTDTQTAAYGKAWDKITVKNCHIENFQRGLNIQTEDAAVTLEGNEIYNLSATGSPAFQLTGGKEFHIINNIVISDKGHAIKLHDAIAVKPEIMEVVGNTFNTEYLVKNSVGYNVSDIAWSNNSFSNKTWIDDDNVIINLSEQDVALMK